MIREDVSYIFFWNKVELYSRGWIRYSQSLPYLLLFKPLPRAQNLIILSSTRSATAIFTKFEKKPANSEVGQDFED